MKLFVQLRACEDQFSLYFSKYFIKHTQHGYSRTSALPRLSPESGTALGSGWAWQSEHLGIIAIIIYLDRQGILSILWSS